MNAKKLVPVLSCALLFLFSSCQKDLIVPEEEALGVISSDAAADDVPETAPPKYTALTTYVNGNVAGYGEGLPARYSLTTKKYPLILFIHGIGELGTGVGRLTCCGLPRHLSKQTFPAEFTVNGARFSFIVVAPQFKVRPSAADMQSVIDYAKNKYRVDETRIYIAGLSMGGGSTLDYAAVYGQNVAAAVPVCGGTAPTQALAKSIASKNLPMWGIYSYGDKVVPAQWGTDWFNWIDAANPTNAANTKLTIYSNVDHNTTWGRAFDPVLGKEDGMNVYEWMLRFKRGSAPAPVPTDPDPAPGGGTGGGTSAPTANAGADKSFPASWGTSTLLNGTLSKAASGTWITSYVWTKVSGPSATITAGAVGQATASGLTAGTYVFRVTVTNNNGATASDDMTVTLTGTGSGGSTGGGSSTGAITANAGSDQTINLSWGGALLNSTLSKATTSGTWLKTYAWSQVSGPANAPLTYKALGQSTVKFYAAGTYVFRATITNNLGATAYDDVTINVLNK